MKLRIHHLFDIVRDFGRGNPIEPHVYGHSYHRVAEELRNHCVKEIQLVISCDEVCEGCAKLDHGHCTDTITHRNDFIRKEDFNDHLDKRILTLLQLNEGDCIRYDQLCDLIEIYLKHIDFIYEGNDQFHTKEREESVKKGLLKMREWFNTGD